MPKLKPSTTQWNAKQRDAVRRFFRFAEKLGLNWRDIASALRISSTTISQLRNEKYAGNVKRIIERMERTMARWRERAALVRPVEFVQTGIAEEVYTALRLAHVRGEISVILGPSGVGKTMALEDYRRAEPETIYVLCGPGSSPRSILGAVAVQIGEGWRGTQYQMRQRLAEVLKGTGRLVIFDDADWLPEETLQHLRIIQDHSQIGVAFVATPAYLARLKERRSQTINQFLGRVGLEVHLASSTDEDLELIAGQFGLAADCVNVLIEQSDGQARRAVKATQNALALANGGAVTANHIRTAFRQLPRLL